MSTMEERWVQACAASMGCRRSLTIDSSPDADRFYGVYPDYNSQVFSATRSCGDEVSLYGKRRSSTDKTLGSTMLVDLE
ncbi:hypothetical protein BDV18DRAFT_98312 [Aspergillus unguis]